MDVGCYTVSAARSFLGEPERVSAHALDTRDCGVDTELVARLEYADSHAQLRCGFDTRARQRYRVDGENGWLEVGEAYAPGENDVSLTYAIDGEEHIEKFDATDAYRLEVEGFAEAAESGGEPPIGREETLSNMRAIDAIAESANRGETVAVGR